MDQGISLIWISLLGFFERRLDSQDERSIRLLEQQAVRSVEERVSSHRPEKVSVSPGVGEKAGDFPRQDLEKRRPRRTVKSGIVESGLKRYLDLRVPTGHDDLFGLWLFPCGSSLCCQHNVSP